MKVSILMNGYNCEKYVREAIDSIFQQTHENWEIIFVDNCSVDNTAEIVKSYGNEKVRYISTPNNIALGAARELGLEYCNSELICFLDTDDLWCKNKLEKQISLFANDDKLSLVYTGVSYIDENGVKFSSYTPKASNDDIFKQQLIRYEINQQSVMIRNNIPINIDQTKRYSVDFNLFMKICARYKATYIPQELVKYRIHNSNLSHSVNELEWVEQKETLDEIVKLNPEIKDKYKKELIIAYSRVSYYKARYLFSIKKKNEARVVMKEVSLNSFFFFLLFVLSLLPFDLWSKLHKKLRRFS